MLQVLYAEAFLARAGPYLVLAVLAVILFRRHRSIATVLMALGFAAVVVGQVSSSFISADVSKIFNSHGDVTAIVSSFHGFTWTLSRYAGTVGMWVAALGAALHVLTQR